MLVGAAIEVGGCGSGRLRLQVLPNSQAATLEAFTTATTAPGAMVHTDGLLSYSGLRKLGYDHRPRKVASIPKGEHLLPRVHRAISNLKAWMHGTPPPCLTRTHARLPRRVHLPSQPTPPMAGFKTLFGLGLAPNPVTYQITAHAA